MLVEMLIQVAGGRADGTAWPAPGHGERSYLSVGEAEGIELCRNRIARPVAVDPNPPELRASQMPPPPPAPSLAPGLAPDDGGQVAVAADIPAAAAAKADWVAYAVSRGAEETDAAKMTKAELIAKYAPASPE